MAPLAYHFGACLSFPSIRTWVTGSHLLWRWLLPAGLLREALGPGDCCAVRLVTARQWANPPGRLRPTELPPGKREVLGCFFFQLSSYFLDFLQYKTVSGKSIPGSSIVGPHSILFIALAEVTFQATMKVFASWFLLTWHNRCEFLCWSLSCLHLIKIKFPDLNPVTFPSVGHAMGLWCQPLSMCLGGERLASGHCFDFLPHHCFCLRPDVPGENKSKKLTTELFVGRNSWDFLHNWS